MRRLTDHKTLGIAYANTSGVFMVVGFLLMLLFRWQLAWPGQPIPIATAIFGENNAPGGILLPEFYYQLVAMHGSVMIFLAVVPMAVGALGSYFVPLQIGAPGLAFPRLGAAGGFAVSYVLFFLAWQPIQRLTQRALGPRPALVRMLAFVASAAMLAYYVREALLSFARTAGA